MVNSHTPLTAIMESDWSTVVHLSAVLRPYWSTEGEKFYSFYTSQASLRLRTQNKCKCNIKYDKTLWRQIAMLNCLSDIWYLVEN